MSQPHQNLGREGEEAAARWLLNQGWTLVKRNYRCPGGEIDLIALDGEVIVAVEVKTRSSSYRPEEAVVKEKQDRIRHAMKRYLASVGEEDAEVRFDIISVQGEGVRHMPDAFRY